MSKKINHPLPLTLIATTLISGIAFAIAWTGPSANPYANNVDVPINAGSVDQTKTGAISANGFVSSGGLRISGNTMLGGLANPRGTLEVNGKIINTAAVNGNANIGSYYDLGVGSIGANSIYGYSSICQGNFAGDCTGAGGVVIGGANTTAAVNINSLTGGKSFFNGGNFGIGHTDPQAKLHVNVASASIDGILATANDNRQIRISPSAASGNYNPIVQAGDETITFSNGSANTGNLVIAPWSGTLSGIRMTSAGNVGIGTTNPTQKLSVAGSIQSSTGGFIFPDGTTQTTAAAGQWTTSGSNIYSANSGNVGIGTTNPIRKLHVDGELSLSRSDRVGYINVSDISGNNGGSLVLRGLGTGGSAEVGATITLVGSGTGNTVFGNSGANYIRGNTYFNGTLYDENNGAYYLDPSSTTNLNDLRFAYSACINGTCPPNGAIRMTPNFHLNSGAGSAVILNWDNGTTGAAQTLRIGNGAGADVYNVYANGNSWQTGGATIVNGVIAGGFTNSSADPYFNTNANNKWIVLSGGSGWANTGAVINLRGNAAASDPDSISMYTGNASRLRIETNGNVGIGTGASYKLDVAGQIRSSSGGYVFPDGTTQTTAAAAVVPGNFIQNQVAAGQSASAWVTGSLKANSGIVGSGAGGDSWLQYTNGNNYLRGNTYANATYYDEQNSGYYMDLNATTRTNQIVTDQITTYGNPVINNTSPTIYFQDSDQKSAMIHNNGNLLYVLTGCGASNSTTWCTNGSNWPLVIDLTNDASTFGGNVYVVDGGNLGVGTASPNHKLEVMGGTAHFSRDSTGEYSATGGQTLSLAENTAGTGKTARIEFHNSGVSEGYMELANGGTRRMRFADNQGSLMGIETTGNVGVKMAPGGYELSVNGSTWTNGWFRTNGNTGWYSETWGGGWYMSDGTWIRSYGSKNTYMEQGFDTLANSGVGCGGAKGGAYMLQVCGAAGVGAAAYYYTSDARLKENIVPLHDSLSKVRELKGYTFNWKEGGRADVGVVAQEVEKVFPQLVKTDAKGYKSVEYGNLVAPLVEAVKELANKFDALATRVFNIENRLTNLEKQNESQAQQIADLQKQLNELKGKK